MLRREDRPVVCALLAVAFALLLNLGVSFFEAPQKGGNNSADREPNNQKQLVLEAIEAAATGALALFAFVTVRDSRYSSRRELRAYISATPTKVALLVDNRTIVAVVTKKNTGQTPAFEYQCLGNLLVLPYPVNAHLNLIAETDEVARPTPTYVFYPGSEHADAPRLFLSDEDLAKMDGGLFALYCFGKMEYLDAFKNPQWAEYCAVLEKTEFFDWLRRAAADPERQPVTASFKFTKGNNRASFT